MHDHSAPNAIDIHVARPGRSIVDPRAANFLPAG
jgi:hypothetical protein